MSGSGLTLDDYRRYQEHMKRKQERERRARAEQERAEQERAAKERADKKRAAKKRAAGERTAKERAAGEQATQPVDESENASDGDNSSTLLSPNYRGIAGGWIKVIWQCLMNHKLSVLFLIATIAGLLTSIPWMRFILKFPLPVPGGSLGSLFMVAVKKLGLPTPTESPSCVRDGPVFSASGQFLGEIAKLLDGKTFEGVDFNFNETLLLEVNRADDRLATVTRSISNHSYHVCRHISRLSEIVSSEPSFLAPFLEFIGYEKSKETVIENETKGFLSTLDHGNTTRSEMINQTRAVYESIGKLQNEFCEASDKVLNIKTDVSEKLSAKKAALQAQKKHTALRQYVARRLHGIDIDTLKMENVALRQRLDEARDLRIHPALGCSGGGIFWSKMRKLEKALKGHDEISKDAKGEAERTLEELSRNVYWWKAAGEELSDTMKRYDGKMNELYYGITRCGSRVNYRGVA